MKSNKVADLATFGNNDTYQEETKGISIADRSSKDFNKLVFQRNFENDDIPLKYEGNKTDRKFLQLRTLDTNKNLRSKAAKTDTNLLASLDWDDVNQNNESINDNEDHIAVDESHDSAIGDYNKDYTQKSMLVQRFQVIYKFKLTKSFRYIENNID